MKKVILAIVVMVCTFATSFAATPAEESAKRIEKLSKILAKVPGSTGVADLDTYVAQSIAAGTLAVTNSETITAILEGNLALIPTAAQNLQKEKDAVVESTKLAPKAMEGLKKLNPLKAGKAKKALDTANECSSLVSEETIYQAQVLAEAAK